MGHIASMTTEGALQPLRENHIAVARGRKHAVVLGAGMAGLFAARVLSDFYDTVTVVERDSLGDEPAHRKGVPQDRHLHNFLGRGVQVLAELFPGILDEMGRAGAAVVDGGDLTRTYSRVGRCELKRSGRVAAPGELALCLASRPFVELHVRRRVAARPEVTFLDGHDVLEPITTGDAVTGVRIVNRASELTATLDADLVVDATGRSARIPALLDILGFGRPREQTAPSPVGYSTQQLVLPDGFLEQQVIMSNQGTIRPRVLMLACEHQNWVLAVGRATDEGGAPADFDTMVDLAREVLPRPISDALRAGYPVGNIATFRNPAAIWRRYDQMPRFPSGLLVIGDALCSLNPIYGQGMTMAALQALTLRDCLRNNTNEISRPFFADTARYISSVWSGNQVSDRAPSQTRGRSLRRRLRSRAVKATLIAASRDTRVAERLVRVGHLIDPASRLRDPGLLPRIVVANMRNVVETATRRSR
jgi:2-polyprenyl-6-methoxyphenol hydroxylase-like FAD-dependent oxidoreductase